jgi:soluble lytic murein transglycosylase-like protein
MRTAASALVLLLALPAPAQVHLTVRNDGRKVISNVGVGGNRFRSYLWLAKQRNRGSRYDPIIEKHSVRYGVDPVLVRAVIQVESDFNPKCVSHRGARGLMQLMPETAKRYGVTSIFDPEQNIRGGVRYLADLLRLFPGNLPRALAAYNAGENAVFKYAGIPPYNETLTYVKRALTVYYGQPYGQAMWFPASRGGRKLAGGFGSPISSMRYLGTR